MRQVLALLAVCLGAAVAEVGARYLIVTHDNFYNSVLPLAAWKQACGLETKVVKLSEVGSDTTSIKNYIITAYGTWPIRPEFVLLVGAGSYLPARRYQVQHDYYSSDNIYGDMTVDIRPELAVGRLPAYTSAQADAMVNKILTYERSPSLSDTFWTRRLTTIVREGGDQSDTVYWNNIRHAAQEAQARGFLGCDSLSYYRGNDADDVIACANRGTGFILYRGSAVGSWYTPFAVRPSLDTAVGKLPIVLSITCQTLALDAGEQMLGDSWMRTGTGTVARGAVAFFGNTHSSGADVAAVRGAVCRGFFEGLLSERQFKLGKVCMRAKTQLYQEYPSYTYDFRGFNLLGDPDMNVWTALPQTPGVTHPWAVVTGPQQFAVTVTKPASPTPVESALVCVSLDTTVYAHGYTSSAGTVVLSINPNHTGSMRLVVSGDNLLPYDTSVTVASAIAEGDAVSPEMRAVAVRPAVFRQAMTVSFAPASSPGILRISNTLGLTVRNLTLRPGTATCCWDGTDESGVQAAPGVYICDLLDSHGRLLGSAKAVRTGF